MSRGWLAQRKNVCIVKSFSVGPPARIPLPAKRRHEFLRANYRIKRDPDSSKYITGIWNWTKRNLLETNCSYLSLSEKVTIIVT